MNRTGFLLLCMGLLVCTFAAAAFAGSYQGICGIPYTGASTDRGIAVNKNAGSPYYGYVYGVDGASGAVRAWKPDANGTAATSYTNTGNKLSYATSPPSSLFVACCVGSDDTVWVADYNAKQIVIGPADGAPTGGNLTTVPINLAFKPRGLYVTGAPGTAGTRVYVAEFESSTSAKCEVFEYDGTNWIRVADLGNAGLARPFFVTVDAQGNSYWASNSTSAPLVKKVKADYTVDSAWTLTKPSFFGTSWTVGGIAFVHEPTDISNPDSLYISAYNQTSCIRSDMNGQYIDGYGNTGGMIGTPPAGTWTTMAFSGPGGNQIIYLAADDARNSYVLVTYPSTCQAYKVHLQLTPQAPTAASASNDVYGQIKLAWTPPASGADNPTGYKIYRGTASGNETLYATTDSYPKWKDVAQGTTAGGPFYYYVKSFNGAGESAVSNEVGPISVTGSSAPAPRSLNIALSYSELNKADIVNSPYYDTDWALVDDFLTDRSIVHTKIWDADPANLNIENDDIAGHTLLILGSNRDMSSYTAQCIKDYVKYNGGRVFSCYNNSIANTASVRQANFLLSDVYRANASTKGSGGSPWVSDSKYRFLKAATGASEETPVFAGLAGAAGEWNGAQQYSFNDYLLSAYTDGTASEVGKWFDINGVQSIADPDDVGIVIGYRDITKNDVQSIYTGAYWWAQATGSLSSSRLLENILGYMGIAYSPVVNAKTIADMKAKVDNAGITLSGKVVTAAMSEWVNDPGAGVVRITPVFYIEEQDRSSGIKVLLPAGVSVSPGDIVNVAGTITTSQVQISYAGQPLVYGKYERAISPIEFSSTQGGTVPKPLYITNKALGGGTMGYMLGVTGGVGLNNVGLLVRISGKLAQTTNIDFAGNYYYVIDDGSGCSILEELVKGIKIIGTAPTSTLGAPVVVTGVIGAEYQLVPVDPPILGVVPVIRAINAY